MYNAQWQYFNPVSITSGAGALEQLPTLVTGERWLMLTSAGFTRRGISARLQNLLSPVQLTVHDQIQPNPDLDSLDTLTRQLQPENFQGIIALGGGSVLDAAKVLTVTLTCEMQTPLDSVLRQQQAYNWQDQLPLIVIPTTSGTGAEVTPFATVWDMSAHKKYSLTTPRIYPTKALLDPTLTLTLPYRETLYTGLDTLSHALESLWNRHRSSLSEALAFESLLLANKALPAVLKHPDNLAMRGQMQQASLLAGLAISQTRTAIAHSISYPVTSHFGVPHGLACSFTLPGLLRQNLERMTDNPAHLQILMQTQTLLDSLDLINELKKYLTLDQLLKHTDSMLTPDRAGNYPYLIDTQDFLQTLTETGKS